LYSVLVQRRPEYSKANVGFVYADVGVLFHAFPPRQIDDATKVRRCKADQRSIIRRMESIRCFTVPLHGNARDAKRTADRRSA
jgi:hypothetical protein